jgi:hypothetical protein
MTGNTGSWFKTYRRENDTVLMRFVQAGEDTIEIATSTLAGVPQAHLRTYSSTATASTAGCKELTFSVGRLASLCEAVQMLHDHMSNTGSRQA